MLLMLDYHNIQFFQPDMSIVESMEPNGITLLYHWPVAVTVANGAY